MRDLREESRRKSAMMEKRTLLQAITKNEHAYRMTCPQTADSDIRIVNAYSTGRSIEHIAMECHCAVSTAYRAIQRVRQFLRLQDGDALIRRLILQFAQKAPGSTDKDDILVMLYRACVEDGRVQNDITSLKEFDALYRLIGDLPHPFQDQILEGVRALCRAQQCAGFCEGVRVGVHLQTELSRDFSQIKQ